MKPMMTEDELYDECVDCKENCLEALALLQESAEKLDDDFDNPALVELMTEQTINLEEALIQLEDALTDLREYREETDRRRFRAIFD